MDYEEKMKRAAEKVKKAEAEVKRLYAMQKNVERAKETKKKIIAGAALLNCISKTTDEKTKGYLVELLRGNLEAKDFCFLFPDCVDKEKEIVNLSVEQPKMKIFGG